MREAHDGARHAVSLDEAVELRPMSTSNAEEQPAVEEVDDSEEEMRAYDTLSSGSQLDEEGLNRRTVRKLDFILLPFLALLFLFNSLDKSNVRSNSSEILGHIADSNTSRSEMQRYRPRISPPRPAPPDQPYRLRTSRRILGSRSRRLIRRWLSSSPSSSRFSPLARPWGGSSAWRFGCRPA